jgi:hypothetical protein
MLSDRLRLLAPASRSQDQIADRLWLGDQGKVTCNVVLVCGVWADGSSCCGDLFEQQRGLRSGYDEPGTE